jgi:hypothetical protein
MRIADSLYAAFGVREFWRYDGERLRAFDLASAGCPEVENSIVSPGFPSRNLTASWRCGPRPFGPSRPFDLSLPNAQLGDAGVLGSIRRAPRTATKTAPAGKRLGLDPPLLQVSPTEQNRVIGLCLRSVLAREANLSRAALLPGVVQRSKIANVPST